MWFAKLTRNRNNKEARNKAEPFIRIRIAIATSGMNARLKLGLA